MVNAQQDPRPSTFLLYSADPSDPLDKMALGFGSKSRPVENTTQPIDASPQTEGTYGYDAEKGGQEKDRKMSRVGGVGVIADSDSQLSVGKQLELEATNSIKYRTCSWQKVT